MKHKIADAMNEAEILRGALKRMDEILKKAHQQAKHDAKDTSKYILATIEANVNNEKLSDSDFREFIRNTLKG